MKRRGSRTWDRALALGMTLGLQFAVGTLIGGVAGYWLDRKLGWPPVILTVLLSLLGAAAGLTTMIRTIQRSERSDRDPHA